MILLFTDFGAAGPYLGQMRAVLAEHAPAVPVIDMLSDAPPFDARAGAYLLAAYAKSYPAGSVFLCVVDPGVGSDRAPAVLTADGQQFVGPENGLFSQVARRAGQAQWSEIGWRPATGMSATFHGRDLFAPVAAWLAGGEAVAAQLTPRPLAALLRPDWPEDLPEICYIDHYGNAVTGLRANTLPLECTLSLADRRLSRATTFVDRQPGEAFWYENANGLVEIAVSQGRADTGLSLRVGTPVTLVPS
ncbi:MAG: SAM hydrolase/SAM-dependent halogenase family protein [Alphaproteobacteria bacterium]